MAHIHNTDATRVTDGELAGNTYRPVAPLIDQTGRVHESFTGSLRVRPKTGLNGDMYLDTDNGLWVWVDAPQGEGPLIARPDGAKPGTIYVDVDTGIVYMWE